MKGASWDHDKAAKEIGKNGQYNLKYTTSPSKTYVMEPNEGKIDYSKSKKGDF